MLRLGQLVQVKTWDELLATKGNRILKNGTLKLGNKFNVTKRDVEKHAGHKITVRNNTSDNISGLRDAFICERMVKPIENEQEKVMDAILNIFDYFIQNGFAKAEKFGNRVVMYYDSYEELKQRIIDSVKSGDFTGYDEPAITAMAKAVDFCQRNIPYVLVFGDDTIEVERFYTYLQFNMDYQIRDGVKNNDLRILP